MPESWQYGSQSVASMAFPPKSSQSSSTGPPDDSPESGRCDARVYRTRALLAIDSVLSPHVECCTL